MERRTGERMDTKDGGGDGYEGEDRRGDGEDRRGGERIGEGVERWREGWEGMEEEERKEGRGRGNRRESRKFHNS